MVGGDSEVLDRARPVLEAMSRRIFEVGEVGSGAAVKLAVNHIIFGINVAVSEALVLAEAAGVERDRAYDVFAGGAAGAPFVQYKRPAFVEPGSMPPAFSMNLAEKDMLLIAELAGATGTPMAQGEVNLASLRLAAAALGARSRLLRVGRLSPFAAVAQVDAVTSRGIGGTPEWLTGCSFATGSS